MNENPLSPELIAWGATYTPAQPDPGVEYWRLITAVGPADLGGNIVIYVDVLDRAGQRMVGVPVWFYWADGQHTAYTEAKPGDPYQGASMPMGSGGNAYGARIADSLFTPSDSIYGMGMAHFEKHQSFRLVFQLATAQSQPVTTPTESPLREALRMLKHWADEVERRSM